MNTISEAVFVDTSTPLTSWTIVEVPLPPPALPMVRSQSPAGVDVCPTVTPAGSTREQDAG